MRGKLDRARDGVEHVRIIPAHAGQTPHTLIRGCGGADHPRACGANEVRFSGTIETAGSSPRMRGKQQFGIRGAQAIRIIPAHAGQTPSAQAAYHAAPDHPRACGANDLSIPYPEPLSGSSPRMRGKHLAQYGRGLGGRIIPAHAGQTLAWLLLISSLADHPRACGANWAGSQMILLRCGSSPRMRGKPITDNN